MKELAIKAAQEAGSMLMTNFSKGFEVFGKAQHDIQIAPEMEAEQRIIQLIRANYPDHNVLAEESGEQNAGSSYTWIIDPLDGTRNYVLGIPNFSVSIAVEHEGAVVLGVVYNPYKSDLVWAEKGCGAFANGERLQVSHKDRLEDAILCSDWGGSEKDEEVIRKGIINLEKLIFAARLVVVHFSPALDLCRLAMGKVDGVITMSTEVEDHAAGALIVAEAGGVVTNFGSDAWDVWTRGIVATNRQMRDAVLQVLQGGTDDRTSHRGSKDSRGRSSCQSESGKRGQSKKGSWQR